MNHPTFRFASQRLASRRSVLTVIRLGLVALATLAATLLAPASNAQAASPDVHVVGVDSYCGNRATVYTFQLANLGDERRAIHGRIAWRTTGFGETFVRPIAANRGAVQRARVPQGAEAVLTIRSQGQVVLRARMYGHCARAFA